MSCKLHLPSDLHFECTSCGRCCQAAWTIAVDSTSESYIRTSRTYAEQSRDGFTPLVVVEGRTATARGSDRACTFLDSDKLCHLHREIGGERKPLVCQTYPYLLTETPEGIYTTLSYACPAVLEATGPALEQSREWLEALITARFPEMPQAQPVGSRVELTQGQEISWDDYLGLEKQILKVYDPEQPVESLLGIAVWLLLAEQPLAGIRLSGGSDLAGFDRELACMVSCNLIAILEDVQGPEQRAQVGSFLWNGGRYLSERFGIELPAFSLRQPKTVKLRELVHRYIRHAIFGKRLLLGTVVSRLLSLSCGLAILLFYDEAFQQKATPDEATDRAFTLVESELLSHTRSFDGFFTEFETALGNIRDSLQA